MAESTAKVAVRLTIEGASQFVKGMGVAGDAVRGIGHGLAATNQQLFFFLNNAKAIGGAVLGMGRDIVKGLIEPNIAMDEARERMQMFGDAAVDARSRLDALFGKAGKIEFGYEETVKAYLELRKYGRSAQEAQDDLDLVGRAAKFANVGLAEVAGTLGNLQSKLAAGQEWDRYLNQLRTMGVITGEQAGSLAEMAKGGATAAQSMFWLRDMIQKTTKNVETADPTMADFQQRFGDFGLKVRELLGRGLFDAFKKDLGDLTAKLEDAFSTGRIQKFAAAVSETLRGVYEGFKNRFIGGLTVEDIFSAGEQGKLGELLSAIFTTTAHNLWEAIREGADRYGPAIMRAMVPDRLEGVLGLKDEQAKRSIASGSGYVTDKEWESLSFGAQNRLSNLVRREAIKDGIPGVRSATFLKGFGKPQIDWLSDTAAFARARKAFTQEQAPYVPDYRNPADAIAKVGIASAMARAAAEADRYATALGRSREEVERIIRDFNAAHGRIQ